MNRTLPKGYKIKNKPKESLWDKFILNTFIGIPVLITLSAFILNIFFCIMLFQRLPTIEEISIRTLTGLGLGLAVALYCWVMRKI